MISNGQTAMTIDSQRLARTFMELVRIDSVSKEEGAVAAELTRRLQQHGAQVTMDGAAQAVGGDSGNLIARFAGNRAVAPLLISAHMDTVEPGRGIQPQFKDGVFTSAGDTILGADDKSALAIILEALILVTEQRWPCGPLEIVLTIGEEIGLLGAKNLDYRQITARQAYVLDTHNPQAVVTRAPCADRLTFRLHGHAAHAGSCPEKGLNAITLAAKAIAQLELGRIDAETTCNIGLIKGGKATNIVPDFVVVNGEARSHDPQKLQAVSQTMAAAFRQVVDNYGNGADRPRPLLEIDIVRDYERLHTAADHPLVSRAQHAAANLGWRMDCATTGGGSDANVFAARGIDAVVLGTGMHNVHTVAESVRLADMVQATQLLMEILRLHAEGA